MLKNERRQVPDLRGELLFLFSQLVIEKDVSDKSEKSECARKTFY